MDSTTRILIVLILTFVFASSLIATQVIARAKRRRRDFPILRAIPAYRAISGITGLAIEANHPVHLAFGSAGLVGENTNTLLALASAELFYNTARAAAIGDVTPVITTSDPTGFLLGQDTLRRAYQSRNLLERYRRDAIRWFPAGSRSLAYAAAISALQTDDDLAANLLTGSFGPELALSAAAANRWRRPLLAASDQLEGQAAAYVFSDYQLIGEEIFAAGAYLNGTPSQQGALVTTDILRWLLILIMLGGTVVSVLRLLRGGS